jgi:hypothetical protein
MSTKEIMELSALMEKASLSSGLDSALEVSAVVRKFRAELNRLESSRAQQTTLERFWGQTL